MHSSLPPRFSLTFFFESDYIGFVIAVICLGLLLFAWWLLSRVQSKSASSTADYEMTPNNEQDRTRDMTIVIKEKDEELRSEELD